MRLGLLPPDQDRMARSPRLAARAKLPPAPVRLLRDHLPFQPELFRNDELADCTVAGLANAAKGVAACSGGGLNVAEENVVQFFADVVGVPVADVAQADGAVLLDVMNRQSRVGLDTGSQVLLTGPYGTIEPGDLATLRSAMTLIAPPLVGVSLSESDKAMDVWDLNPPASAGDPTPGSWGLHLVVAWDYTDESDAGLVRFATWGGFQSATWRWVRDRMIEAHVAVWRDLMLADRLFFSGLDYDALVADVAALAA